MKKRLLHTALLTLLLATGSPARAALEAIAEHELGTVTGEGILMLPENFSLQLNSSADNAGAGFLRYIPVGPLTSYATTNSYSKADVYLYGLTLSQSSKDIDVARTAADRGSALGRVIDAWGSFANPWLLKVATANVPNFGGVNTALSYVVLEAPRYQLTRPTATSADQDQYNLKLGLWADAFLRDPTKPEGDAAQFYGANANRFRLNALWDGLSLNGSQVQLFQTMGGATNADGMSTSYNNTLGLAGLVRLNSGESIGLRATSTYVAGSRVVEGYTEVWSGTRTALPDYTGGVACDSANSTHQSSGRCLNREQTRAVIDSYSERSWTAPVMKNFVWFSTRETSGSTNVGDLKSTPALNGGAAPSFDTSEGLFLYNLNVNLALGSLSQPLILNASGTNFSLELTRIPNQANVYKKIYTNYDNANPVTNGGYYGSTCNIHSCGTAGTTYQGVNATHSSISIGSTEYNSGSNLLTAHSGLGAVGVSFGAPTSYFSSTAAATYRDVQRGTRTASSYSCGFFGGSTCWEWNAWGGYGDVSNTLYAATTWTRTPAVGTPIPAAPAFAAPPTSAPNNFGSVAIDGLLIQHMKLTTKGL